MLHDSTTLIGSSIFRENGNRGKGIKIAIIDTGIDYTHPDLGGGFGTGFKVVGGYDFINADSHPMDDHGHGTHCAGIVAGKGDYNNNGIGNIRNNWGKEFLRTR